ncbi:flagellar basal-body MS-ring/collar protein FliF [Oceanibacterium hippocampi]|nr:flagellar basal-body MS-ring/collar protein FliF [Oceanibacterium hippocampi]
MGIVALATVGFLLFMANRISTPAMGLLYSGLDGNDAGAIAGKLESMNVPFELRNQGADIMVPSDQVLRLRMSMAQEGLPNGGSVGYEIFDRSENFGTTSFVQNINRLRALEGELSRTIRALDRVSQARVHLVLPKREVFSRDQQPATASIILKLRGAGLLNPTQVAAVQHIVAAAVPGLSPERISIADERGNLLARGGGEGEAGKIAGQQDAIRVAHEDHIKRQIETLLERSVGVGNVRAEVTAEMDFDEKTVKSETYDPEGQVVRSTQLVEETNQSSEVSGNEAVTVQNNLPEADAGVGSGANTQNNGTRSEETVNYEISKTVTTKIQQSGVVKRLAVAVLVNGVYTTEADGTRSYQPRNEEELEKLASLARSAIGYDAERGDVIEVVNLPFAEGDAVSDEAIEEEFNLLGLNKADLFKIAEMAVLAIVAILALLLVVRPLLTRAMAIGGQPALAGGNRQAALAGPGGGYDGDPAQIADGGGAHPALEGPHSGGGQRPAPRSETEHMLDIARIDGQVKASSLKKMGEIVDKHPDEAVGILRSWLYEDA